MSAAPAQLPADLDAVPLPRASLLGLPLELLSHILDFVNLQDLSYEDRVVNSEIELCRDIAKLAELAAERRYDRGVAALYRTCRPFRDLAKGMMFERIFLSQTLSPYFDEHIIPTHKGCIQAVVLDDHKSWTEPYDLGALDAYVKKFYLDVHTKLPSLCRLRFSSLHCQHHFLSLCATDLAASLERPTRLRATRDLSNFYHIRDNVHTVKFPVGFSRHFDKRMVNALFPHLRQVTIATVVPSATEEALAALQELNDLSLTHEGIWMSPRLVWRAPLTSLNISIIDHDPATSNNWSFVSQFSETLLQLQLSAHFQIRTPPNSPSWIVSKPFSKLIDLRLRMSSQLGLELLRLFSDSPIAGIDLDLDEAVPLSVNTDSNPDEPTLKAYLEPFAQTLQVLRINRQEEPFAITSPLSLHLAPFLQSINTTYLPNRYCDHPTFYKPQAFLTEEELRAVAERGDVIVRERECVEGVREVLKFAGDWLNRSVAMGDQMGIVEVCALLKPLATRMLTERD